MKNDHVVFVGRFQPFHNAHLQIVKNALKEANHLIIVVGSYRAPISIKNPFTFEQRKKLIEEVLYYENITADQFTIIPLRDYIYNDNTWIVSLQHEIAKIVKDSKDVKIIGHFKDDTSYYLNFFPNWKLISQPNFFGINGVDIRNSWYKSLDDNWGSKVHNEVWAFLQSFKSINEKYLELTSELKYIEDYKKSWEKAPFPPVFVTVDNIVIKSGHILLIKRKINPGKGKYAIPGGFVGEYEELYRSALRELKEETNIDMPLVELEKYFVKSHVFDHPLRSSRGRTITHAHLFQLDNKGILPKVEGGDDAKDAMWVPISDLPYLEETFFEDHIHIINYFLRGGF